MTQYDGPQKHYSSKRSQTQKTTYGMSTRMKHVKGKSTETENRFIVWAGGDKRVTKNGHE